MNKNIIFSLTAFLGLSFSASALTVTIDEAGTLKDKIANPATETNLVIQGNINAIDLDFISQKMAALESLDLGAATIEGCEDILLGTVKNQKENTIPANIFAGAKFTSITLPRTAGLQIGSCAFALSEITEVDIPATVAVVDDAAFANCPNLTTVVCGAEKLGTGVFANCPKLTEATFLAPTAITAGTFKGDAALQTIKGDITSIDKEAFSGCTALESFPFSSKLSAIGREAILGSGLKSVDIEALHLDSIGDWAFAMMPRLTALHVGSADRIGQAIAFACPSLEDVGLSETYDEIPDLTLAASTNVGSIEIKKGTTRIGSYALSGLSGVKGILLPESIEEIGDNAMENMTGLKSVYAQMSVLPALGEKVWEGVDQPKVDLHVENSSVDMYANAEQWQNFKIIGDLTASVDDEIANEDNPQLSARFDGDDLHVQSTGLDIDSVALFDPSGRLLIAVEPMSDHIIINTNGFATQLFLISATLSDGRMASLKLIRR